MFWKTDLRILAMAVMCAAFPVSYVAAQETQDSTSVAEAAKRAREQKQSAAKPSKVVTNDTLAPAPASTAVASPAASAPATSNPATSEGTLPANAISESSTAPADTKTAVSAQDEEKAKAEIESLKRILKQKEQAASLLQRELALEQDNFYRKQDYQRDNTSKQKLDGMQADLQQMLDELTALKAKLTDLAGADALKETPATAPNAPENSTPPAQPQP